MSCDICGRNDAPLTDLLESYQTDDIKQLCPVCEAACNRQLSKLRLVTHNILRDWLKRFMSTRKATEKRL